MNKYFIFSCLIILLSTGSCNNSSRDLQSQQQIDFKNPEIVSVSDIMGNVEFVKLQTTQTGLLGEIIQLEVYNGRIYVLDLFSGIVVFSIDGEHIATLSQKGNGPGELISPFCFRFDEHQGYLLVYDIQLSKLLRYDLEDFSFIDEIQLPLANPVSFFYSQKSDLYYYFYAPRQEIGANGEQIFVATPEGKIKNKFLAIGTSSNSGYSGSGRLFYDCDGKVNFYPFISDEIYQFNADSVYCRYKLSFGNNKIPDKQFFETYKDPRDRMNQFIQGNEDFIRMLIVFENSDALVVNYYIRTDLYCGIYDKKNNRISNFKYKDVKDDLGIGGQFPPIIGKNGDRFIALLSIDKIDEQKLTNIKLKELLQNSLPDDNPVLAFIQFHR